MIELHTLGDAVIKVGTKEVRPTSPMVFAALLYLCVERGRRVPRAALQELLFPNADERSGAHSLRQLLYKLRQLGAPIEVDATSVVVSASSVRDETDLTLEDGATSFAERASTCVLGWLPNYAPRISQGYADWLDGKRSAVEARIRRRLISALSSSRELIDWRGVERFAQLLLQIDPFNEEATYALAEATAATTSKATALSMLERYAEETQRTELTLPSSMLRRRISENLRDLNWRRRHIPFLGRDLEVSIVRDRMLAAKTGDASAVLVTGEVGLGKSRLVEEMATLAALEGMQVQFVRCQPHHVSRPLGVFIELVPSLLALPGALGVAPHSFKELNVLTSRTITGSASGDARDASTRSLVVLSALRDLMDAVTTNTAVVVIVEDAQWADQESLRELQIAADRGRRLLILLTARPSKELVATFTSPRFSTIRLGPLSHAVMETIGAHIVGPESEPNGVLSWCVTTASGNPLFLQTLCSHYVSTGIPYAVPANLRDAISSRIAQLSDPCRRLLQLCALLGRHSSLESIRSLADSSDWTLIDSVQSLEDAGFLQIRGAEVRVAHDLLKEAALATLSPIALRLFHGHVARYLEALYDAQRDAIALWDCAEHWAASGDSRKAVEFFIRCATHAAEIGQVSQAAIVLDRAASIAQSDEEHRSIIRAQMLANKSMGRWASVHELAAKHAAITTATAEDHSDVELISIEADWMVCFTAGESTKRLLRCVSSCSAPTHRCEAALLLMRIAHERGNIELAHSTFALIEEVLSPETTEYSVRILPLVYHTSFGDRTLALRLAQRFRQDLREYPAVIRFRAAMNVATAFGFLGADRDCVDVCSEYYAAASAIGLKEWACDFAASACWKCVEQEMLDEAEHWYRTASQDLVSVSGNGVHRKLTACACELAIHKGDLDRANRLLIELRAFSSAESVRVAAYILSFETRLQQADPRSCSSDEVIADLVRLHEASRSLVGADFLTVTVGEALRRRGRTREARILIDDYVSLYRRERSAPSAALLSLRARMDEPTL